jgi:hypothetical protein
MKCIASFVLNSNHNRGYLSPRVILYITKKEIETTPIITRYFDIKLSVQAKKPSEEGKYVVILTSGSEGRSTYFSDGWGLV